MISVLLPSRGRPAMLQESIRTLFLTLSQPKNAWPQLEVLVALDDDDIESKQMMDGFIFASQWPVSVFVAPRVGYSRLFDYYNLLASKIDGRSDFLMLWNDDAEMTSPNWNERIEELPPEVLLGNPRHNLSADGWNCFPVVRRSMTEAMGHFCGPSQHVDSYLQQIAETLGVQAPVDIYIDHKRPDITGGPMDLTFLEGRSQLDNAGFFAVDGKPQIAIKADIEKLRLAGFGV